MKAMVLTGGVCHTELDEIEGRTPPSHFPDMLGAQLVGAKTKATHQLPLL